MAEKRVNNFLHRKQLTIVDGLIAYTFWFLIEFCSGFYVL